jgi:hypothetical protein
MTKDIENLLENVRFIKKTKQLGFEDFELFKKEISSMNLPPDQYVKAIVRLCEAMEI